MTETNIAVRRRGRNLTQEVTQELSRRIQDGEFATGQKLPTESVLMGQLGVSRTVVREAISRLQAAGVVETRHGIGTFILSAKKPSALSIDGAAVLTILDVMSVLELRISLETEAAGLAARRRQPTQLDELHRALETFENALREDPDGAIPGDVAFHLQVALASGNRYFHDLLKQLGESIIPRARLGGWGMQSGEERRAYLQRVAQEHVSIYEAIERQDEEGARAAMRMHLSNSRERLRRMHAKLTQQ